MSSPCWLPDRALSETRVVKMYLCTGLSYSELSKIRRQARDARAQLAADGRDNDALAQAQANRAVAFSADLKARDREGPFVATSIMYVVSGRKTAG
jgi:hypothetical protein